MCAPVLTPEDKFLHTVRIYSDLSDFLNIYILQCSEAMQLRCGGTFCHRFMANFPQSVRIKNVENRSVFGVEMGKSLRLTSLGHPVGLALSEHISSTARPVCIV